MQWEKLSFSVGQTSEGVSLHKEAVNVWYSIANGTSMPENLMIRLEKHPDIQRLEAKLKDSSTNIERAKLLQHAENQRLHTDLQKSIFLALMESSSPTHAVQRILEIAHQKHQVKSNDTALL